MHSTIRITIIMPIIVLLTHFYVSFCFSQENVKQPVFDAQSRLDWHAQHLEMQSSTPFKNLKWKHIGPYHMSGRVTDIAKP